MRGGRATSLALFIGGGEGHPHDLLLPNSPEDLLGHQGRPARGPCRGMGAAIKPDGQPLNIERRGDRQVLEAGVGQAPRATVPQPERPDALGERPFHASPRGVWRVPRRRVVLLPYGLEGLMLGVRA